MTNAARCRFCHAPLSDTFVDLGMSPPCQTIVRPEQLNLMEAFFPLHAWVCGSCYLVQLEEYVSPEDIFTEYAYFSSYSTSWVEHARRYTEDMRARFGLNADSLVVEVAANDGYLLQHFVAAGVPCLGIEPAKNVAAAASEKGIPVVTEFFGEALAKRLVEEGRRANLIAGNNVFAHVPDINDFSLGLSTLLAPGGVVTLEFPHLMRLMDENQFDTIYHEHFSYLSLTTAGNVLRAAGLDLFDVQELPTHGGSLRLFACHADDPRERLPSVAELAAREDAAGLNSLAAYARFEEQVKATKRAILRYLIDARDAGRTVVGYGAPGKGMTLLNYCGIGPDLLDYTVDRSLYKQGNYTPGTRIPIHPPERIAETRPDEILILPWNLRVEIAEQLAYTAEWGCKLVVPIPTVQVIN